MLCCVYHVNKEMRVVEQEEADKLVATGVWFNSPYEAKEVREKYERQIRRDKRKRVDACKEASEKV